MHSKYFSHLYSLFSYIAIILTLCLSVTYSWSQRRPITFSVLGDMPYGEHEVPIFQGYIDDHNRYSRSLFFVHVGDIMSEGETCEEFHYSRTADILKGLEVPTYIILGDNEWNDCSDPNQALSFWMEHLFHLEQNSCGLPDIHYQEERPDNFAFVKNGVLFMGISMPSGGGGDAPQRLEDNAEWVEFYFQTYVESVRAAVLFAHSDKGSNFVSRFEAAAINFAKPILYAMGNGHNWKWDRPFNAPNIQRVQVDNGGEAPPIEITVGMDPESPFAYDRDPWPPGTPEVPRLPCIGPAPVINITNVQMMEGNSGTSVVSFEVVLQNPIGIDVSVNYATRDSTAKAYEDYIPVSGTLNFLNGSTREVIDVLINGDDIYEGDEVFSVVLDGPRNAIISYAKGLATIINDEILAFTLDQNYPNPFNPSTSIPFELPRSGNVSLKIYDIRGKLVETLIDGQMEKGSHMVNWQAIDSNGLRLPSGRYFYRILFDGTEVKKKMTVLR